MTSSIQLAGVDVPRIGLGTNRLTQDNVQFVRDAVEAGLRHIDTAHLYTGGESEKTIGAALPGGRDDLVIATKGGYHDGSAEAIDAEVKQSLESLQTDTIDLWYLHRVDSKIGIETSLETVARHVDAGRIRAVGISEVSVDQIERARGVIEIAAVQNHYNTDERKHDEVVDYCEREGIVFVPFFPLGGSGSNADQLRWLLDRSSAMLPIPGTLSLDHLRENLSLL